MTGRQGGKKKPLKAPKPKEAELDEVCCGCLPRQHATAVVALSREWPRKWLARVASSSFVYLQASETKAVLLTSSYAAGAVLCAYCCSRTSSSRGDSERSRRPSPRPELPPPEARRRSSSRMPHHTIVLDRYLRSAVPRPPLLLDTIYPLRVCRSGVDAAATALPFVPPRPRPPQ